MFRIYRLFLAAVIFLVPVCAFAHDIPSDVTVQMFVKPEGQQLHLLIRVPLRAMRDISFPERANGYLDLARASALLPGAAKLWIAGFIELYEGDTRLPNPEVISTRISLPSDFSFTSYEAAYDHLTGPPLPNSTDIVWDQTLMDVLFDTPIQSEQSRFSIQPRLARLGLRVVTVLRFLPPGGAVRAFELDGNPGLVRLDPRWYQAALSFVRLGFLHILDGTDHLLFLFCLVIPLRSLRALIPVVTAFTVAHSITLIASAYNLAPDFLWFPPLIETLIAASIVYMALENIVGANSLQRRWMIAFGFGLVHGFGFSFALRQSLQFAGSHMLTSLLSFNVGVELGQLLVLVLLIPVLQLFFKYAVAERMGTIILSALVAHTGWHWMLDRGARLQQFQFEWPAFDAALLAMVLRWLIVFLILGGLLWLFQRATRWWAARTVPAAHESAEAAARLIPAPIESATSTEPGYSSDGPN
ncbi:MAG TPA: HupE/UreJ family protein [Candidatus Acidoferrum sp.]|nr:HupE/UreJ family protein [Candidatus Acidoferrum sp.]